MTCYSTVAVASKAARITTIWAFAAVALVFAATAARGAERVLDRTFTVAPDGLLTVKANGASLDVVGSDANQVVVHMTVTASKADLEALELTAEQTAGGVEVKMLRAGRKGWFNWGSSNRDARIEVKVPRSYRVEMTTSGGDIHVKSIAGPSRANTSGGDLRATQVGGDFTGHTSGGDVRLETISGKVNVRTSGGDVQARSVQGDVDASTSGGSVELVQVSGKMSARTSGGEVRCDLVGPNRGIFASTSGGSVRLTLPQGTAATLDAATGGGQVRSDFPVEAANRSKNHLSGLINGGGEEIHARTSGGDITLDVSR